MPTAPPAAPSPYPGVDGGTEGKQPMNGEENDGGLFGPQYLLSVGLVRAPSLQARETQKLQMYSAPTQTCVSKGPATTPVSIGWYAERGGRHLSPYPGVDGLTVGKQPMSRKENGDGLFGP